MTDRGKKRLQTKITQAQFAAAESRRAKTHAIFHTYVEKARGEVACHYSRREMRALCALAYWCEGAKDTRSGVNFTNSDPYLVKAFLVLLRKGFALDESKFRACIHLHEYHDADKQLAFWSNVTHIPKKQFIRPYRKPHTGKRTRDGYEGCISVRYSDVNMSRELYTLEKELIGRIGNLESVPKVT